MHNSTLTPLSPSTSYVTGTNANYVKGYPIGTIYEYYSAGVNNSGQPLVYGADGNPHMFITPDGRGGDVHFAGTSIPPINMGLNNRIDIGRFYFYCMVNYYGGFKVKAPIPTPYGVRPLNGAGNYWKKAGDENIPGILPSLSWISTVYSPVVNFMDTFIVRGDYFTIADVTASYNFADLRVVKKAGFKQFEVKIQASNLYTFAWNKYNYSLATGSFAKPYVTPTYTIALFTNL